MVKSLSSEYENAFPPYYPFKSQQARKAYLERYDTRAENWPVSSENRLIETSFGETFVRVCGPQDAPPLVLLHGISGNSLQWIYCIKDLTKTFRVYCVDTIADFGRSVARIKISEASDYVNWLDELFDQLGFAGPVNLAGLSYGGWIAAQYCLKHQDRLSGLILLASVGVVAPISPGWIIRAISVAIPIKFFTRSFMYWLAEDTVKSGDKGKLLVDEHVEDSFLAMACFVSKKMVNPTLLTDGELASIKVPVLFMVGENEKTYSLNTALDRLRRVGSQFGTCIISNAGHDLTLAQSEQVAKRMVEFLEIKS